MQPTKQLPASSDPNKNNTKQVSQPAIPPMMHQPSYLPNAPSHMPPSNYNYPAKPGDGNEK